MFDIEISKIQARELAQALMKDISAYIEAHREEFEEFLREEVNCNG